MFKSDELILPIKLIFDPISKRSNFQDFKNHLQNWSFAHLKQLGDAINTGVLPVFPEIPNPPNGSPETIIHTWKTDC